MRKERLPCRPLKSSSDGHQEEASVNHRHLPEAHQQRRDADKRQKLRQDHRAAAVVAVCDVSREEREYQKRSDLHKPDIAEYERRSGFDIQIPAHGKRKHLRAEIGEEQACQQQAVITGAKRGVGVQLKSFASSYGWPE